ncbi:MAG TPA: hypothetical protein VNU44_13515 [Bryobacteraceae bacterium]|nr:hypothetical protein [Bryobacteraceae bacterium]
MKFTLFFVVLCSMKAGESTAVINARQEIQRVQWLVNTGALPPVKIAEAQQNLEDAMDEAVLERTLYGHVEESSEEQASEMVAGAQRRVDRQQKKVSRINEMIALDLVPPGDRIDLEKELSSREDALQQANVRAALLREIATMAHAEAEPHAHGLIEEKTPGSRLIEPKELKALTLAFEKQFSEPFPISAKGMTAVHRALGMDHTGRVDVALNPDSPEGIWLREHLDELGIPYYAFRAAIAGKATAPHIHIGPGSTRLL